MSEPAPASSKTDPPQDTTGTISYSGGTSGKTVKKGQKICTAAERSEKNVREAML